MVQWQRLEALAHSENRTTCVEVDAATLRFFRARRSGGATTLGEDIIVSGVLAGLPEELGAIDVHAAPSDRTPWLRSNRPRAASGLYSTTGQFTFTGNGPATLASALAKSVTSSKPARPPRWCAQSDE